MIVAQLIAELQKVDPELPVCVDHMEWGLVSVGQIDVVTGRRVAGTQYDGPVLVVEEG